MTALATPKTTPMTTPPGDRRPTGIRCPKCAGPLCVRKTEQLPGNVIRRRRQCRVCAAWLCTTERASRR